MPRLVSVQYLRGVAALLVVFHHIGGQLSRLGYAGDWPSQLFGGVDLFFVISGFIMWATTSGTSVTPQQFFYKRLTRIVPLYWLVTTVMVFVALTAPQFQQTTQFEPVNALASYLFIPYPNTAGDMLPILVPGWTLNYEMLFYAIFGLGLLVRSQRWRMAAVGGVLIALGVSGLALPRDSASAVVFWTHSIILEFLFGMIVAATYQRMPAVFAGPLLVGGALLFLVLPEMGVPRVVGLGLPSAALVAGAVVLERTGLWHVRLLSLLGDASYSLYLTHVIVLSAASQMWRRLPLEAGWPSWIAFVLFAVGASLLVGGTAYHIVERPLIQLFQTRAPRLGAATQ